MGASIRHGHTVGHILSPTYRSWYSMITRCAYPTCGVWAYYGGRGITVCERWQGRDGFQNFLADMTERPEGKTLGRINNEGNYEPGNCRWETKSEQMLNRRKWTCRPRKAHNQ